MYKYIQIIYIVILLILICLKFVKFNHNQIRRNTLVYRVKSVL